jgi:hypothetical protein
MARIAVWRCPVRPNCAITWRGTPASAGFTRRIGAIARSPIACSESPGPDAWLVSTHTAFSQAFVERFDAELAKRRALSGADCLALLDDLERDAKT